MSCQKQPDRTLIKVIGLTGDMENRVQEASASISYLVAKETNSPVSFLLLKYIVR